MPASKKRIQRGAGAGAAPSQHVPAALRDWVHIWHGVQVRPRAASVSSSAVFHSGSRMETLSFWQQLVRLPSNSLFSTSLHSTANPRRQYKDFLYVLLNMRWPMLILVLLAVFLFNIIAFAVIVWAACGDPSSLQACVNLSYQTFSTIGFGIVYPTTTCSNLVMVVESFASMLVTSAITGLVFAKFAKPKAKVAFSKVCVVQPYGKQYLALVVRVANATQSKDVTHDVIMESTFKLNLLRIERNTDSNKDGDSVHHVNDKILEQAPSEMLPPPQRPDVLCSYNLKLLQNNFITFRMGLAVVHVIDEQSPLFGLNEADIAGADMILEVSMSGVDSTLQDTVTERYTYTADDFKWGYRFAELLEFNERNSEVVMDFAKLSAIERAPIDDARYVSSTPVSIGSSKRQISFRGNAKSKRPDLFARSAPARAFNVGDIDSTGSVTSQESASSHDSDSVGLRAIDELSPDDAPEANLRRGRSDHTEEGSRLNAVASPRGPRRFSLGMEPLFEPLLKTSVGTQRLHPSHAPHHRSEPNHAPHPAVTPPHLLRGTRLASAGMPLPDLAPDEVPPVDFLLCEQQRRRLQDELAGDVQANADEDDTSLDGGDDTISVDNEEESDNLVRRRSMWRSRSNYANQSAVSIDVQDTPRFLNILPMNIPKSYDFMRLYNSALYERWPRIIIVFVIVFMLINAVFGLLYWFYSNQMVVYTDISLKRYELAFFMSVHTLATIGYGSIAPSPSSSYMNFWVLVEASLGIIFTTIITGIAWSKFARPRAHIHFSSKIVITNIYGHRCLVFRAANTRHSGDVHENLFRIGVILTNRKTGLRQLYDVPLVTAEWPSIKLPATLIHIIDESSPFYKFQSIDNLSESRVSVIVLLTGLDTTFSENVYARKMYFWDDFAYNMRFADFAVLQRDRVEVDFIKFDTLEEDDSYVAPTPLWEENEDRFDESSDDDKVRLDMRLVAAV